jgi:TolB protein
LVLVACSGADEDAALVVYEANDVGGTNVYVIDPDTHEFSRLTNGDGFDGQPAWSADRERIIYISDDGERPNMTDVYTMLPDGTDVRRLTSTPNVAERSPKYAPDGSRIAVVLNEGRDYYLATVAPDGSDQQVLTGRFDFIEFPSWRRDGKEIYFAGINDDTQAMDILSVNVETREVRTRVSTPSADVCPHFSYDGKYLTYARSPEGTNDEPDIFRRSATSDDVAGTSDERLTDAAARDDYANPSPDDERYVFLSNRDGDFDLYVMDFDGTNATRITDTPDLKENVPDW